MSLFNKSKLGTKKINLTSINIIGKYLLTGDANGVLEIHEIKKNELTSIKQLKLKSKIIKICVPQTGKLAFVQTGSHIFHINLEEPENPQSQKLSDLKDISDIFINSDEPKCKNMLLTLSNNKGKVSLKIYEFDKDGDNIELKEIKTGKDIYLDKMPECATWTEENYFIYTLNKNNVFWLNCKNGKIEGENKDYDGIVDISNFLGKAHLTGWFGENMYFTFFNKKWVKIEAFNPVAHTMNHFYHFFEFDEHAIAFYENGIVAFKPEQMLYNPVETINFDDGEKGILYAVSKNKIIIATNTPDKHVNFIEIQGKTYEDKIKILLNGKEYNTALEILIHNEDINEEEKKSKLEEFYLDCAWAALEGNKKDFETSIKFLSVTNFNPFEFIYMFFDVLNTEIIHKDKENDIKKNQLINQSDNDKKQKEALEYLVTILQKKRDYLEILIKSTHESEKSCITFISSNRGKINLSSSKKNVTFEETFYAINLTLVKILIKLRKDPKEIEKVLDNNTINYININNFKNEPFFSDPNIKNLDETKFTLSYIEEKNGNNNEKVLEQWKIFGEGKNEKYSLIGKDRTKKMFYKFKETKNEKSEEKEKLFKIYIIWLLEKYQEEAFEVITKSELISDKIFVEEILTKLKSDKEKVNEEFLEYCDKNHKTESYQNKLLELYIDKIIKSTGKEKPPKKLEGDAEKYYKLLMDKINSKDSIFNKKIILEYIDKTWLKEIKLILLSQLKEYRKALELLFKEAKEKKSFEEMESYCNKHKKDPEKKIFEIFYQILSEEVKKYQDEINQAYENMENAKTNKNQEEIAKFEEEIKKNEEKKNFFENEMLEILNKNGNIDTVDPMVALDLANDNMNICEKKDFFNYLKNVVKDFTIEGNKYKVSKSLSQIGLAYKIKEDYDIKKKHVKINSDMVCDLCKKKIGSLPFAYYPNNNIYHVKCIINPNIDPLTGINFSKTNYIG